MVVLSFWWKHLIVTVRCLILGTLEQPFRDLIPSENFGKYFIWNSNICKPYLHYV